jgi:hypothetical protein
MADESLADESTADDSIADESLSGESSPADAQVHRLERCLLQHPRVDDALAFIHDYKHKGKYSLAFVVPNGIISTRKLNGFLAEALPGDPLPDYIIKCDRWPLNADGTINTTALARQAYAAVIGPDLYVEPRTETERRLAVIWREITGAPRVSLNDTFFDIGGTAAQLEQVNRSVGRAFSVELPLSIYQTFSLQQVVSRLTRAFKPVAENA